MSFVFTNYRVHVVEHDTEADYCKDFDTDHYAAHDWYIRSGNAKETCGIPSTTTLEKQDEHGEWVAVFKREVFGWL